MLSYNTISLDTVSNICKTLREYSIPFWFDKHREGEDRLHDRYERNQEVVPVKSLIMNRSFT